MVQARGKKVTLARKQSLPSTELASVAGYIKASKAPATLRGYQADWEAFEAWCAERGLAAWPAAPATAAAFLSFEADQGHKVATIEHRAAAIRFRHVADGINSPTKSEIVRATLKGIRNKIGVAPSRKAPATAEHVKAMSDTATHSLKGLRDRALLLLGFASALRRSELVALDLEHIEQCPEGFRLHIARSKTDQEGRGAVVPVLRGNGHCPVRAVQAWIEAADLTEGPLFRPIAKGGRIIAARLSAESVADIVKAYAARAELDPAQFSGHRLRAGFLTSSSRKRASLFKMMQVSRHRSVQTVQGYVRDAELFEDHAGTGLL